MSHALTHATMSTCTPSSPSSPTLASRLGVTSLTHVEDPLPPQERGSSPELPPPTSYEHNRIVDNQIFDDQENMSFTEIEDRVKTVSYNQSFLSSTQDPAENIATSQEADFFVLCWLHHCTYKSEKQLQNDHKSVTLNEKDTGARSKCRTITSVWLDVQFISRTEACRYMETCRSVLKLE